MACVGLLLTSVVVKAPGVTSTGLSTLCTHGHYAQDPTWVSVLEFFHGHTLQLVVQLQLRPLWFQRVSVRRFPDMSIQESTQTESTDSKRNRAPRNGLALALLEADPDTPLEEIPQLVKHVERWVCAGCGKKNFGRPHQCAKCRSTHFEKVVPGEDE